MSPRAGEKGTVPPCLTHWLPQSPQLPNEGTLMAVYDKSGYSHSETSLVSIIYLSRKVRLPTLLPADAVANCPLSPIVSQLPRSSLNLATFPLGQNCDLRG